MSLAEWVGLGNGHYVTISELKATGLSRYKLTKVLRTTPNIERRKLLYKWGITHLCPPPHLP